MKKTLVSGLGPVLASNGEPMRVTRKNEVYLHAAARAGSKSLGNRNGDVPPAERREERDGFPSIRKVVQGCCY